jgi:DNA-binding CsgD family transcriptional regulator
MSTAPPQKRPQTQREVALEERAARALARTEELVEHFERAAGGASTLDQLEAQVSEALAATATLIRIAAAQLERPPILEVCEVALELAALHDEVRRLSTDRRLQALSRVQEALSHLRGLNDIGQMINRSTEELCRTVGFDRAVLFREENSEMVGGAVYVAGDPAWAESLFELTLRVRPRLDHSLIETEMIRRRAPVIVADPQNDPRTNKELVQGFRTRSYVAAPVMPHGRVIGFLHADHYFAGRDVDAIDRDALWTFAEGFGYAFERTTLRERLWAQRSKMKSMMAAAATALDELTLAEVEFAAAGAESEAARSAASMVAGLMPSAADSRLRDLLTRRELEVLRLMADGLTNAHIADQLVISRATVKSHVAQVLRKLRAANRAEAVSRYMKLVNTGSRGA